MYYLIRFVLFILEFSILFLIMRLVLKLFKTKLRNKNTTQELVQTANCSCANKSDMKQKICIFIVIIVFIFIASYPIEGFFLTFDSLEDSLSYSCMATKEIDIYESESSVFVIPQKSPNNITISKIGNKYGLANFQSESLKYYEPVSRNAYITGCMAEYNKSTNETFYYIELRSVQNEYLNENSYYEYATMDSKKMHLGTPKIVLNLFPKSLEENTVFYYIDNNPPTDKFELHLFANDFDYKTELRKR